MVGVEEAAQIVERPIKERGGEAQTTPVVIPSIESEKSATGDTVPFIGHSSRSVDQQDDEQATQGHGPTGKGSVADDGAEVLADSDKDDFCYFLRTLPILSGASRHEAIKQILTMLALLAIACLATYVPMQ